MKVALMIFQSVLGFCTIGSDPKRLYPEPTFRRIPDPDPTLQVFPDPGQNPTFFCTKSKVEFFKNHLEALNIGTAVLCPSVFKVFKYLLTSNLYIFDQS